MLTINISTLILHLIFDKKLPIEHFVSTKPKASGVQLFGSLSRPRENPRHEKAQRGGGGGEGGALGEEKTESFIKSIGAL